MRAATPAGRVGRSNGGDAPDPSPDVSVVITAYNRRGFLARAILSVLAQTVPRERYEILVVKNFEDAEIDALIAREGIVGILRTEQPLGLHLAAAMARARGEVVAFLNDDDLWTPDRLALALRRFSERPELGFQATSYTLIDEFDRPIDGARDRFASIARFEARPGALFRVGPSASTSELEGFAEANPGSDSTIAVRASILRRFARELEELPSSVDTFLLTLGLLSGLELEIEYVPMTRLRVHPENMSRATDLRPGAYLAKYARTMGGFAAATSHMLAMTDPARFPWLHERLEARFESLDHFARMASGSLTRAGAIRGALGEIARRGLARPGLLLSEGLYAASPSLARSVNFLVGRRIAGG